MCFCKSLVSSSGGLCSSSGCHRSFTVRISGSRDRRWLPLPRRRPAAGPPGVRRPASSSSGLCSSRGWHRSFPVRVGGSSHGRCCPRPRPTMAAAGTPGIRPAAQAEVAGSCRPAPSRGVQQCVRRQREVVAHPGQHRLRAHLHAGYKV